MKRLILIFTMLSLIGAAYADGPRYRFKSRRALQRLWRNEVKENPNSSGYGSRKMTARELQGENDDKMKRDERVYGVAVADPFDDSGIAYAPTGGTSGSGFSPLGLTGKGPGPVLNPDDIDGGLHVIGEDPSSGDPFHRGTTGSGSGYNPYEPPKPPVGDGLHILLILTAAFVAIKKRLSD